MFCNAFSYTHAGSAAVASREYFWANLETTGRVITQHTNRFLFSIHWRNIRNGRNNLHCRYVVVCTTERYAARKHTSQTQRTANSNNMQIIISEIHTAANKFGTHNCAIQMVNMSLKEGNEQKTEIKCDKSDDI